MSPEVITALVGGVVAIGGWLGGKGVIDKWLTKRDERERDSRDIVEAQGNIGLEALKLSIAETREQMAGLKGDVTALKAENQSLERKVDDLRRVVEEYRSGLRVPVGQVLIPLPEVRAIREQAAGLLKRGAYPGEFEDGANSIDVRMYPLPPGGGGRT